MLVHPLVRFKRDGQVEGALLSIALAVVFVLLVVLAAFVFQLVRQHGLLLLRLEQIEQHLAGSDDHAAHGDHGARPTEGYDDGHTARGLAVGAEAPAFALPNLDGDTISLDSLRGKRALLVHWSTTCGFCEQIAPDLAALQDQLRRRNTELILVSYGDREPNTTLAKENGLECQIVLQDPAHPADLFRYMGTPSAYLVDETGRIAKPLASGMYQVLDVAREAASGRKPLPTERPLTDSRLPRDGLRPGAEAPAFALPDLSGRTVSLADFRGRRVLLVFSDPECGPCNQLLPDLEQAHRRSPELNILMVSRGEAEANRAKVTQHALTFPVLLQRRWEVCRDYATFATPVGYLIDQDGRIATALAAGREAILALASRVVGEERRPAHTEGTGVMPAT